VPADAALLERFSSDCAEELGPVFRAVVVFGEDQSADAISTLLVVDRVTTDALRQVASLRNRWSRKGFAAPLVLDAEDLATSADVFPLELLAMTDSHRLLRGQRDPLAGLELDHEHLRLEVEQQLKGKILHLRQAFLSVSGDGKALATLLADSSAGFEMIMRGLLALAGRPRGEPSQIVAEVEGELGVLLDSFRRVQAGRLGGSIATADAPALFDGYLDELRALARLADRITRP
jgi:hypothetical protein